MSIFPFSHSQRVAAFEEGVFILHLKLIIKETWLKNVKMYLCIK